MALRLTGAPHRALLASLSLLSAVFIGSASLDAASRVDRACGGVSVPREIRLHVINEAGAPPEAIEAAVREAQAIWEPAGVRLTFTFPPEPFRLTDGRTLLVMIRQGLPSPTTPAASVKGKVRRPLGWLTFDSAGRPGVLMEVSLAATTMLVQRGTYFDRPLRTMPVQAHAPVIGQGLGRVIAHELGHWVLGRGHTADGLMQRSFGTTDLVEPYSPRLPQALLEAPAGPCGCERATSPGCASLPEARETPSSSLLQ